MSSEVLGYIVSTPIFCYFYDRHFIYWLFQCDLTLMGMALLMGMTFLMGMVFSIILKLLNINIKELNERRSKVDQRAWSMDEDPWVHELWIQTHHQNTTRQALYALCEFSQETFIIAGMEDPWTHWLYQIQKYLLCRLPIGKHKETMISLKLNDNSSNHFYILHAWALSLQTLFSLCTFPHHIQYLVIQITVYQRSCSICYELYCK